MMTFKKINLFRFIPRELLFFLGIFFIFCFSLFPLVGENLYGNISAVLHPSLTDENGSVFYVENLIGIDCAHLTTNLTKEMADLTIGMEVEITIPEIFKNYRNSFALFLYKKIAPYPNVRNKNYQGSQFFMHLLPSSNTFTIKVLFQKTPGIKSSPYSVVIPSILSSGDSPFMLAIYPISKAFPDSIYRAAFKVRIKPILMDKGYLSLGLNNLPHSDTVKGSIDGNVIDLKLGRYQLKSGYHKLRLYKNNTLVETINFIVESGKQTDVSYTFRNLESEVILLFPSYVDLYLDGKYVTVREREVPVPVKPGKHTILYVFNKERYVRDFTVFGGEKIKFSLIADLKIEKY